MQGVLLVVCGPSGVGKGTINKKLLETQDNLINSISATTRKPRINEEEGKHYYFISEEEFEGMIKRGEFLEWAKVHGYYYGTPKMPVFKALGIGLNVLLEIDVQGALQIKENYSKSILIFLIPPNMEELERRLRYRGTEDDDEIARRLKTAEWELTMIDKFDYAIINDEVDRTYQEVLDILKNHKGYNKR
ncbi:MAG: guanylate kinase [Clostridia bacterium]